MAVNARRVEFPLHECEFWDGGQLEAEALEKHELMLIGLADTAFSQSDSVSRGQHDIGAEFLFQVISERAERAAILVTTNLPFSEWTTVFPNPRLCKAVLDRITDRAHIIETGTESFRFRRTFERSKKH